MNIEEVLLLFGSLIILIFAIRLIFKMAASIFKFIAVGSLIIVGLYVYKPTIYNSVIGEKTVNKIETSISSLVKKSANQIKKLF